MWTYKSPNNGSINILKSWCLLLFPVFKHGNLAVCFTKIHIVHFNLSYISLLLFPHNSRLVGMPQAFLKLHSKIKHAGNTKYVPNQAHRKEHMQHLFYNECLIICCQSKSSHMSMEVVKSYTSRKRRRARLQYGQVTPYIIKSCQPVSFHLFCDMLCCIVLFITFHLGFRSVTKRGRRNNGKHWGKLQIPWYPKGKQGNTQFLKS